MKILPLVKGIQTDISSSGLRLKNAASYGYNIADRTAKIYHQSGFKRYFNVTRSITSKVVAGTTTKELPYLAGAIGLLIPVPLMSPVMMAIGFLARFVLSYAEKIHEKTSQLSFIIIGNKSKI